MYIKTDPTFSFVWRHNESCLLWALQMLALALWNQIVKASYQSFKTSLIKII